MTQQIIVNTLEFQKELQNGTLQADLFERIAKTGATGVEVRREFIHDFDTELTAIKDASQKYNLAVFYSVPEELFVGGKLNPDINTYLGEGQTMEIVAIKFNVGDYADFSGDLSATLKPVVDQKFEVNVENDQTQVSGTKDATVKFLSDATAAGINIGYVYDIGNWPYVGGDYLDSARALAKFNRYIHLKDVVMNDGKPAVVPLNDGILDWKQALEILPKSLPIAIEYPAPDDATINLGVQVVRDYLE